MNHWSDTARSMNATTLLVRAYLEMPDFPRVLDVSEAPKVVRVRDLGGTWTVMEVIDALRAIAVHWRRIRPNHDFWRYVRFLETVSSEVLHKSTDFECAEICCVLSYLWGLEHLGRVLLSRTCAVAPPRSATGDLEGVRGDSEGVRGVPAGVRGDLEGVRGVLADDLEGVRGVPAGHHFRDDEPYAFLDKDYHRDETKHTITPAVVRRWTRVELQKARVAKSADSFEAIVKESYLALGAMEQVSREDNERRTRNLGRTLDEYLTTGQQDYMAEQIARLDESLEVLAIGCFNIYCEAMRFETWKSGFVVWDVDVFQDVLALNRLQAPMIVIYGRDFYTVTKRRAVRHASAYAAVSAWVNTPRTTLYLPDVALDLSRTRRYIRRTADSLRT
jgi:hypothetical protein